MDMNERIHIELLKRIKIFSETYFPNNSKKSHNKINYKYSPIIYPKTSLFQNLPLDDDHKLSILSRINPKYKLCSIINQLKNDRKKRCHEKNDLIKKSLSPDLIKMKKRNLNNFITSKNKNQYNHLKTSQLINSFHGKNQIYKNVRYIPEKNIIKINFVNQKFKIADDFNEKNSNQFLKEKDEYLKKVILSDEIEEEEYIPFRPVNEKESINELSYIKGNGCNDKNDSEKFILD